MAFTVILSVLAVGCGIKYATNKVLSNPDAIANVGAVYDKLNPRDTAERLYFIQGDSIVVEKTDTIRVVKDSLRTNTIYVTKHRFVGVTDTIVKTLPPDNRKIARLSDTIAIYKALAANLQGKYDSSLTQVNTAEKRLIWMAAGVLILGTVIGVLLKFKLKL